jgi:hypothetical protein
VIELMLVVGIMSVVMGIAAFQIGQAQPAFKGDSGMRVIMAQLNMARELAITQRRQMQVIFTAPNLIQITRIEVGGGTTVLSQVPVEGGMQYTLITGIPDTPDGFGIHAAPDFGSATKTIFNTDGTLIDQTGNPLNGTVYLAIPQIARSFRAITILGGTGRVRGYRWDGREWTLA